jgi:hypothetical protein
MLYSVMKYILILFKPLIEFNQTSLLMLTWLFEDGSFAPLAKLQGQARYSILRDHFRDAGADA